MTKINKDVFKGIFVALVLVGGLFTASVILPKITGLFTATSGSNATQEVWQCQSYATTCGLVDTQSGVVQGSDAYLVQTNATGTFAYNLTEAGCQLIGCFRYVKSEIREPMPDFKPTLQLDLNNTQPIQIQ